MTIEKIRKNGKLHANRFIFELEKYPYEKVIDCFTENNKGIYYAEGMSWNVDHATECFHALRMNAPIPAKCFKGYVNNN